MDFKLAIKWAKDRLAPGYESFELVDKVREYFNKNNIEYSNFSHLDLEPYL